MKQNHKRLFHLQSYWVLTNTAMHSFAAFSSLFPQKLTAKLTREIWPAGKPEKGNSTMSTYRAQITNQKSK